MVLPVGEIGEVIFADGCRVILAGDKSRRTDAVETLRTVRGGCIGEFILAGRTVRHAAQRRPVAR